MSARDCRQSVGIFWDYENCCSTSALPGHVVAGGIRRIASEYGAVTLFKAYLDITEASSARALSLRSELQCAGVSLTDCPHNGRKDVADKMMLVDMLAYALDNVVPATVVLISGDRDFAYAVSILRLRGYHVVLILPPINVHISLTAQASAVHDWTQDVLGTGAHDGAPPLMLNDHTVLPSPVNRDIVVPPSIPVCTPTGARRSSTSQVVGKAEPPKLWKNQATKDPTARPQAPLAPSSQPKGELCEATATRQLSQSNLSPANTTLSTFRSHTAPAAEDDGGGALHGCDNDATQGSPPNFMQSSSSVASSASTADRSSSLEDVASQFLDTEWSKGTSADSVTDETEAISPSAVVLAKLLKTVPKSTTTIELASGTTVSGPYLSPVIDAGQRELSHFEPSITTSIETAVNADVSSPSGSPTTGTSQQMGAVLDDDVSARTGILHLVSSTTTGCSQHVVPSDEDDVVCSAVSPDQTVVPCEPVIKDTLDVPVTSSNSSAAITACVGALGGIVQVSMTPPSESAPLDVLTTLPSPPARDSDETASSTITASSLLNPLQSNTSVLHGIIFPAGGFPGVKTASTTTLRRASGIKAVHAKFRILLEVLEQLRSDGVERLPTSTVASKILKRDKDVYKKAGVDRFKAYYNLALQEGLVTGTWDLDGNGQMSLHPNWHGITFMSPNKSLASSSQESQPSSIKPTTPDIVSLSTSTEHKERAPPEDFHLLMECLERLRVAGVKRPLRSVVARELLKQDSRVYGRAGLATFKDYSELAVRKGLVIMGATSSDAWISLHPDWHGKIVVL